MGSQTLGVKIKFKVLVLTFKDLRGLEPTYLKSSFS